MTLRLRIPRQIETCDPQLEIRKPYVEEWIEGLPYINTLLVIRHLFDKLRDFNRSPLRPSQRIDLLEAFLPPVLFLQHNQARLAESSTVASFERNRTDTDGTRQLMNQLAYGYKLALVHSDTDSGLFGQKRLNRLATQRTAQCLGLVLTNAYHEYLPRVPHVWLELGQVYQHALKTGVANVVAPNTSGARGFGDSVANAVIRTALLTLVDPFKLGVDELWPVHGWLGEAATKARLISAMDAPVQGDGVFIPADADSGPIRPATTDETVSVSGWYLDPHPAAAELIAMTDTMANAVHARLAKRCADLIVHRRERDSQRIASNGLVDVATSLSSLLHFVSLDAEPTLPTASAAPASVSPAADEIVDIHDVEEERGPTLTLAAKYRHHPWEILNRSTGGVSMRRPEGQRPTVLVGDVLGVRYAPQSPWNVGLVRWLSITHSDDYRIGVELLSNEAQPVVVSGAVASVEDGRQQPLGHGLLLPGRTGPGSVCLVMSSREVPRAEIVFVSGGRTRLRLRLRHTIEAVGTVTLLAGEAV